MSILWLFSVVRLWENKGIGENCGIQRWKGSDIEKAVKIFAIRVLKVSRRILLVQTNLDRTDLNKRENAKHYIHRINSNSNLVRYKIFLKHQEIMKLSLCLFVSTLFAATSYLVSADETSRVLNELLRGTRDEKSDGGVPSTKRAADGRVDRLERKTNRDPNRRLSGKNDDVVSCISSRGVEMASA